jgi:hypothetical protein
MHVVTKVWYYAQCSNEQPFTYALGYIYKNIRIINS